MKRKINITMASLTEGVLLLQTNESFSGLLPLEQILVDSEQFSFIYLMEDKIDYTYIVIPENIWPSLREAIEVKSSVILFFKEERQELKNFLGELEDILNNIRGNSNYGEEMLAKVEKIF
ncbi:hypothetical protein [Bacillus sp. MRMR6]|uniref:UPF0738 family protein n=1 Tax=Bacillus sp. MRMR6 TaxID=1928617 RepID=UPI00095239A2|nr:hypothetical protein [Bacillus sp. MRMR6]OLS41825.1 hypothetical protein BTR25_00170 [Bacillus sp. MRMR6]